jgi:hypothetical protein
MIKEVKNWTHLVKDGKAWYELVQNIKAHKGFCSVSSGREECLVWWLSVSLSLSVAVVS